MYLSFNSKVMTASQITDYLTRVVQPRLQTINGVANAQILGGQTFAMRIWLNPDKMAALGVTPRRRAQRARQQQLHHGRRPGEGRLRADDDQRRDLARQRRRPSASWSWLTRGDALIRLDDIATIELGPENVNSSSVFDGLKAVFIGIYATPTANPLTVIGDVRKAFPDIQRQLPAGIEAAIAYDATKFINASIEEVEKTLLEAAADRHRRDLPVPRQSALDADPDRHHPAVADRRDVRAAGARLFDQPADAAGAGARHRPRRRRRHRRGREHPPPHRGGHAARSTRR